MSDDAATRQMLSFQVDGEDCAIDLAHVREIVRYEPPTRVPGVSDCVRGVINLRGNVVPVIDLATALGLPAESVTAQTCLLVVETPVGGERAVVGLTVGSVSQVLELAEGHVEPPPSFGTKVPAGALVGVTRVADGFVLLLDLVRVLDASVRAEGALPVALASAAGGTA